MMRKICYVMVALLLVLGGNYFAPLSPSPSNYEKQIPAIDEKTARTGDMIGKATKELYFAEPEVEEVETGHGQRCIVRKENGSSYTLAPGHPMLPTYTATFTFPLGTKIVNVECRHSHAENMHISNNLMLAPEPYPASVDVASCPGPAEKKRYDDSPYPSNWYSYHTGGGLQDGKHVTFLSVHLYPVRYIPTDGILQYIRNTEITVRYNTSASSFSAIENGSDLVVISPSLFSENLEALVEHKNNLGVNTTLVSLQDIYAGTYFPAHGRDRPEKVKYFIKEAVEHWGTRYVLLVGDKKRMPVRYAHPRYGPWYHTFNKSFREPFITDLYYADLYNANGSFCSWDSNQNGVFGEIEETGYDEESEIIDSVDLYPDVCVGRVLCHSPSDVEIIVNKTIGYEKNTFGQSWFKQMVVCGGNEHPLWKEALYNWQIDNLGLGGEKTYPCFEGEYIGNKITEIMSSFRTQKLYASAIFPSGERKVDRLTRRNINEAINKGAGFVVFNGHGSARRWGTHPPLFKRVKLPLMGYTRMDVRRLHNGQKLPIAVLNACSTGNFNATSNPLAWAFVGQKNGGAIASYACTRLAWVLPGTLCTATLNGYITTHLFTAYAEGKDKAGTILVEALNDYLNNQEALTGGDWDLYNSYVCIEYWELFGDPSLKVGGYP